MHAQKNKPIVLAIAGSDSSGGAGVQIDLKTIEHHGCFGATIISATTAQNTIGIFDVHEIPFSNFKAQLDAVLSDFKVAVIKTGMLPTIEMIQYVAKIANDIPLIVDPVFTSTSGTQLGCDCIDAYKETLIPIAKCVTPNIPEAQQLLGQEISDIATMKSACEELIKKGCKNVLLKGGHLSYSEIADVYYDGNEFELHRHPKVDTPNLHGTGCVLSSALACNIANGLPVKTAARHAIQFLQGAIESSKYIELGNGNGPVLI